MKIEISEEKWGDKEDQQESERDRERKWSEYLNGQSEDKSRTRKVDREIGLSVTK